MASRAEFTNEASRQLRKPPPDVQARVLRFLHERVTTAEDPHVLTSKLVGELSRFC